MLTQKELKKLLDRMFQGVGIEAAEGEYYRFQSTKSDLPLGVFIIVEPDHYFVSVSDEEDRKSRGTKLQRCEDVLNKVAKEAAPQIAFKRKQERGSNEIDVSKLLDLMRSEIKKSD